MKDTISKMVSLGVGLAVVSKEQVEKVVEELVKKGEVSRAESVGFVEELLNKGHEARNKVEELVKERVQSVLSEGGFALKEDVERLELRLAALEESLNQKNPLP